MNVMCLCHPRNTSMICIMFMSDTCINCFILHCKYSFSGPWWLFLFEWHPHLDVPWNREDELGCNITIRLNHCSYQWWCDLSLHGYQDQQDIYIILHVFFCFFIECFMTTFLRALAKLGRWGWWRGWGWKARRRYIHQKDYVELRPESPGVWTKDLMNLINLLPSLGLRTQTSAGASSLRVPTGVWNVLAGGRLQLGLKLWSPPPPRPKEEVFKVFEPKLVGSLLYAMI